MTTRPPAQPNQSLIDGLEVLRALAASDRALGTVEIAKRLDLETTRANRLLKTLGHLGLAEQNASRKYRGGPAMHVLAAQALRGSSLLAASLPALRPLLPLADRHEALLAVGVLWKGEVSYLVYRKPGRSLEECIGNFGPYSALESSIGRLLSALAGEPAPRGMGQEWKRTERSRSCEITAPRDRINLSVPIGAGPGIAAIALSGVIASARAEVLGALREAASAIESHLGRSGEEERSKERPRI